MKMQLFLLSLVSALLVSCAKTEKTKTGFKFNTHGIYQSMNLTATHKVALMGTSQQGYFFSQVLKGASNTQSDLEIPNGEWTFYALAWDDVNTDFGGDVICGSTSSVSLSGSSAEIDLNLNKTSCPSFGKHTVDTNQDFLKFKDLILDSCSPQGLKSLVDDPSNISPTSSSCLNNFGDNHAFSGQASSYLIKIKSLNNFSGTINHQTGPLLSSGCIERSSTGTISIPVSLNIPFDENSVLPVPYEITQFFNSNDCGTVELESDYASKTNRSPLTLPLLSKKKILKSNLSGKVFETTPPDTLKLVLVSSLEDVCKNTVLPYFLTGIYKHYMPLAGNGSESFPYSFCKPENSNINEDWGYVAYPHHVFYAVDEYGECIDGGQASLPLLFQGKNNSKPICYKSL